MACALSKDSDQPGHLPSLIRVFTLCMKKAWVLSYPLSAQQRLRSDWMDAQADLCLHWAHMPFCYPHAFSKKKQGYCYTPRLSVHPSDRMSVCNVTPLLLDHLSQILETFTGNSPMDENWRNTFEILMCPWGQGQVGVAPKGRN